jgi:multiple sugar transport system ATP-binding protein
MPDRADREVWVGIRPEGFIPDEEGPFTCQMDRVEVMGRDVSVVSTHLQMTGRCIRSIVSSEKRFTPGQQTVRFRLKPFKVYVFDRESGVRLP